MVKKKIKSTKKGRRRSLKEDVHASTSLPPSVEGQLRCFLRVSVSKIVWLFAKPPDTTHVRLKWWGEITEGSTFRPLDVKNPQKTVTRTVARYPVRCGPKQFAAYLNDMGTLCLEVLKGTSLQPLGKAQINEIGHLAPQVPINGFYSVFSNKSADKIAELHASLVFEPLPAAYDSSSSVPTTDLSVATAGTGTTADSGSVRSQSRRLGPPVPMQRHPRAVSSSGEDPFMSPIPKVPPPVKYTEAKEIITPRGVDTDYSFVVGPGRRVDTHSDQRRETDTASLVPGKAPSSRRTGQGHRSDSDHPRLSDSEAEMPLENREPNPKSLQSVHSATPPRLVPYPGHTEGDLIAALLSRGTRLRDNMIRSELDQGLPAASATSHGSADVVPPMSAGNLQTDFTETGKHTRPSSGELFREILRTEDSQRPSHTADSQPKGGVDVATVELLIGDQISTRELSDLKTLQSGLSPRSSVSSESDVLSETEDPLKDQSILEELFYKGESSSSDSSLSLSLSSDGDEDREEQAKNPRGHSKGSSRKRRQRRWSYESSLSDPGNQRPPSRRSDDSPIKAPSDGQTAELEVEKSETGSRGRGRRSGQLQDKRRARSEGGVGEAASSESDGGSSSRLSEGSRVSFQEPLVSEKKVNTGDGLSVQRLTLLGRIHIARVMVDTLALRPSYAQPDASAESRRPSRVGRGRGKPPRPVNKTRTKKCTYFVEYHFPVAASQQKQSLTSSTATEVMRLVSKTVDPKGGVTFGHRSVFPVIFDGAVVDNWWKHLLIFKIFSRYAGQKTPSLVGVASLPLRSVLESPDLSLLNLDLEARDKTRSGTTAPRGSNSNSRSEEEIGTLKVSIELSSDSKDFPMALARLKVAEMKGTPVVPLPSHQPHLPIKIPTGSSLDSDAKSSSRSAHTDEVLQDASDGADGARNPSPRGMRKENVGTERLHELPRQKETERGAKRRSPRDETAEAQVEVKPAADPPKHPTDYEARTLHFLLMVPEGQGISLRGLSPLRTNSSNSSSIIPRNPPQPHPGTGVGISGLGGGRDQTTRNTYLVCRLFWSDDSVRSNVCWGTTEPDYNFMQVCPVLLTPSLLQRARNNCMVIEIWDKKTSAQNDQLVGIAKLPLHQFYMSFRDERIAGTLLKSQYPVAAVDNYVSIVDPFTGVQYGQLKVLLALGSSEQISALQRLKCDKDFLDTRPQRPSHRLERGEVVGQEELEQETAKDEQVEHIFEVVVEGIQGLPQLEDTVWGEADCFVQYHFPSLSQPRPLSGQGGRKSVPLSVGPTLVPHKTPTTLCMPDPTFHDVARHRLRLARGLPVQRELLTACAGVGGGAGGIPFEVWCRYYYPNIRDQVVAKASLPLAKLCAMVTMQRRGEPSIQSFSLPLRLLHTEQDSMIKEQAAKLQDAGLLDVTINYRHSVLASHSPSPKAREMGGPQVCLSVSIVRACGLKSAAKSLALFDTSLQYPSEVGVNAYVKMELSFLSKQEIRVTQTVARSFAPEFSHHVDFPCPLLFEEGGEGGEGGSDHLSLAEALEMAEMTLQVWHQVPGLKSGLDSNVIHAESGSGKGAAVSARRLFAATGDILLGAVKIPLQSLLSHRTGLQGWYPLSTPNPGWSDKPSARPSDRAPSPALAQRPDQGSGSGGGLELAVKFARQGDRERVIDAGWRVGWSPDTGLDGVEDLGEEEVGAAGSHAAVISVHVDSAWFPAHVALKPGQQAVDTTAKAYIRYKFYDKGAVCSKLCYLDINDDHHITADFKHNHKFRTAFTQPLAWYLREERLEIQLWLAYNRDQAPGETGHARPSQRDKLIGCGYVDLSALCEQHGNHHRTSGLYPLFRPGAGDLAGSCLRAHLSLRHIHREAPHDQQELSDEVDLPASHSERHPHPGRLPRSQELTAEMEKEASRKAAEEKRREEEEEEARRRCQEPVLMSVVVERAMHLASVPAARRLEDCSPSCYVTFKTADGEAPVRTPTVANSEQPMWGSEQEVLISSQVLDRQSFIFKVWHQTGGEPDPGSDRMLGFASVDLAPLLAGFRSLNGWYHVLDFAGHCQGQLKVSLTPKGSVSPLRRSPRAKTTPNTSAVFAQAFPSVPLAALPHPQAQPPPPMRSDPPPLKHYQEHLSNIRRVHRDLHDRLRARQQDSATPGQRGPGEMGHEPPHHGPSVSGSFLMQNLRKNLEELDTVYQHLQKRLADSAPLRKDAGLDANDRQREPSPSGHASEAAFRQHQRLPGDTAAGRRGSSEDVLPKVREALGQEDAERLFRDVDGDGRLPGPDLARESDRAPSLESDWEDNVQFQPGWDRRDEEVVVIRPLNDVSSAHFSNSARPDAVLTSASKEPGSDSIGGTEYETNRAGTEEDLDYDLNIDGPPESEGLGEARKYDPVWSDEEIPASERHLYYEGRDLDDQDLPKQSSDEVRTVKSEEPEDSDHERTGVVSDADYHRTTSSSATAPNSQGFHPLDAEPIEEDADSTGPASPEIHKLRSDRSGSSERAGLHGRPEDFAETQTHRGGSTNAGQTHPRADATTDPERAGHGGRSTSEEVDLRGEERVQRRSRDEEREDRRSPDLSSDDSVVITIESGRAERQAAKVGAVLPPVPGRPTTAKSPPSQLPNFFLPSQDLEASMRALYNVTSIPPRRGPSEIPVDHGEDSKLKPNVAAKELTQRLASKRPLSESRGTRLFQKPAYKMPTAEEARRIAKIFGSTYKEG